MGIKGITGGTRLRYLNSEKLDDLQDMIESLPYKVEIQAINKVGNQWYIHFLIPIVVTAEMPVTIEQVKETKVKRKK